MSFVFGDGSNTPPPKLSLASLPRHKPPPEPLVTPPFQPMVSVPFQWEEAPGRPKTSNLSTPFKPKSVRCLKLPPAMPTEEAKALTDIMPSSPTTVLSGPLMARSTYDGVFFENLGPKNVMVNPDLGSDQGTSENDLRAHFESCRCTGPKVGKRGNLGFSSRDGGSFDVDVQVKITRFKRSRGSLYELTRKSSLLLEGIYGNLKQMMGGKSKRKEKLNKV